MTQYRIQWKSFNKETNTTIFGHGKWHDTKEFLEEDILYCNEKYKGEIHHWLQTK